MAPVINSAWKPGRRHGRKGSGCGMQQRHMLKKERIELQRLLSLELLIVKERIMTQEIKNKNEWPLWEVFIRSKAGLDHKHAGSLHAADAQMAIENARDVYTRRMEGVSIWVVESKYIHASDPGEAASMYDPANDKIYRHPTFYNLPDEVKYM
jgi:ring-1,2-phenylacetyl-CoA epoxidase subunit PaaB